MTTPELLALAAIYQILSEFDSSSLREAAQHKGLSPQISSALNSLAREAGRSESSAHTPSPARSPRGYSARRDSVRKEVKSTPRGRQSHSARYKQNMLKCLGDTSRFPTKKSLLEFLESAEVHLKPDSKASRTLIANRAVRVAEKDPKARERLNAAVTKLGNGGTKEWLDLISRSRKF